MYLHGIGHSGDSANEANFAFSNQNPLTTTRNVTMELYETVDVQQPSPTPPTSQLVKVGEATGTLTYQGAGGVFTGTVDAGSLPLQNQVYSVKLSTDKFLRRTVGFANVVPGGIVALTPVTLIAGNANSDLILDILDYNIMLGCYSDQAPARACSPVQKIQADFQDDGNVNQFDYNLFLRELGNRSAD